MTHIKFIFYLIKDKIQNVLMDRYIKHLNKKRQKKEKEFLNPFQNGFPLFLFLSFPLFHILFSTPAKAIYSNHCTNGTSSIFKRNFYSIISF